MQFQVPQFIDVEDKIFGPFTVKQFIYLAGAVGIIFVLNSFLPFFFAVIIGGPVIALGVALAFYKVNNRPFINIVEAVFKYILGNRLYIWKKEEKKIIKKKEKIEERTDLFVPK
ncbi:PrgI family protein, partial [Patescibacteria group bacterium]|nr:PrgI family protein [Patescibacteria group bacterium]